MIENLISPKGGQPFIWFAKYKNGEMITEFDNDGKENKFKDIRKEDIETFGLLGCGNTLSFDATTGEFDISGSKASFILEEGGKQYPISNIDRRYDDIITYKSAYKDVDLLSGTVMDIIIDAYFFGYKLVIKKDNGAEVFITIIFNLPVSKTYGDSSMRFGIKVSSDDGIDGNIVLTDNYLVYKTIPISAKKRISKSVECIYY